MQQTIIMRNLKTLYYKNNIIENDISPFFLSILLYNDKKQFDKDKESRKELLSNTITGISKLRWLLTGSNYYSVSQFSDIEFDLYFELCKELVEIIIEKKWKRNIVIDAIKTISNCSLSRRITGDPNSRSWVLKNVSVAGVSRPKAPEDFNLEKELKLYLVSLDSRYNRYVVDEII